MLGRGDFVPEKDAIQVEITTADGGFTKGRLWASAGKSLADTLNGPAPFLEFTAYGEERVDFIAKAHVASLRTIEIPKTAPLYDRRGSSADDPYRILGLQSGASWFSIREAYLRLAKSHHPDSFSSVELPDEVREYLDSKIQRINAAYGVLEDSLRRTAKTGLRATVHQAS